MYDSVETFKALAYGRVGQDQLDGHLAEVYGVAVASVTELDAGVLRVDRADGTALVARLFPAARPVSAVEGDAAVLRFVEEHGFPAERCVPEPVTVFRDQGVLVTGFVAGTNGRDDTSAATLHRLGDLLGRLHTLPPASGPVARDAGSWHSLSVGGGDRSEDVAALTALLSAAEPLAPAEQRPQFDRLRDELAAIDVGLGLPRALTHPDFGPANVVRTGDGELVLVDWTGAGQAPRICALGLLLSYTGASPALVDAIVDGYRRHVVLEPEELDRLPDSIRAFGAILACWGIVYWGAPAGGALQEIAAGRHRAAAIAAQASTAFTR